MQNLQGSTLQNSNKWRKNMSTVFHGMLMMHIITLYLPTKMSGLTAARMGAGIRCIQAAERSLKVSEKLVFAEVH